jgi:hypothetical protein
MLAAATTGAGHPAVAILLGLGAVALAGVVVAMAWNVHVRQLRLAEHLSRRQFIVGADTDALNPGADPDVIPDEPSKGAGGGAAHPPVFIDGPETVIAGEQARFRARTSGGTKVVSWAVGGGSVSQAPDPAHPDELLLIADQPAELTIFVRAREGMMERRATKTVLAVQDVADPAPPFPLRLFLQSWGLVTVAVVAVGFAAALVALGSLTSADFIALAAPLAAILAVIAIVRGADDPPRRISSSKTIDRLMPSSWKPYQAPDPLPSTRNGHHRPDVDQL